MKIKYALLDKLNSLTNKEVDFILYVARYQDDYGCIRGMYYRDVCENADMCKQTFYDTLRSLQAQGIITYSRVNQDYDITILDNDFRTQVRTMRAISMYPDRYFIHAGSMS